MFINRENEMRRSSELRDETRALLAQFLEIEVNTSITFAEAALFAGDDLHRRVRNQESAMKGYGVLQNFLKRDNVDTMLSQDFFRNLSRLKIMLQTLGETVV